MNSTVDGISRLARGALLISLLAIGAVVTGCAGAAQDAVGVNAVMTDPGAYSGQISIKGVVQAVDPATANITMIDEAEYATCGLTPCNSAGLLPVSVPATQYDGGLPALKDVVVVVGEIKSNAQGSYLDVERVERGGSVLISRK